ncbi:MAG: RNA polymerase factor sigma-54 [Planctomycetota bacterium]|nr:RNA polymerase factor sigma-54 [Planctomycetota bacterium]
MRLETRVSQRQEQRLLPQMLQSIQVLQSATAELLALVAQEVATNEVLELAPGSEYLPPVAPANTASEGDDGEDPKRAFLESQAAPMHSLIEHVREQLLFLDLSDDVHDAVISLAVVLDPRGLLPVPVAELSDFAGLPAPLAAQALSVLRSLEPRGLAASSGVEAMLAQACGDPDFAQIKCLLTRHLDELARNKLPDVARALLLGIDELMVLIDRIADLDPSPGSSFSAVVEPPIVPDVRAWLNEGRLHVVLTKGHMPQLSIDAGYSAMAADKSLDRSVRDYLRNKVRTARDLIAAIELRQSTLLAVSRAVLEHQIEFLSKGRRFLRPLRMALIADQVGMHTSTVSRAIAGKYVATELGVMRLRDFFDGARDGAATDSGKGRGAVAQRIQDLIDAEDQVVPLSDDDLCGALAREGVVVARRTVAKFRSELGIASSYQRRSHGGKS